MKHSQRISATPLLPWVIVEKQGTIVAAHCTCMAGYTDILWPLLLFLLTVVSQTWRGMFSHCSSFVLFDKSHTPATPIWTRLVYIKGMYVATSCSKSKALQSLVSRRKQLYIFLYIIGGTSFYSRHRIL